MADDLRSSSARPAYVDRLALSDVPFTATVTEARFYQGPAIVQRLNLILHLLRATQRVPLLVADNGVGKTTVLDELARRAGTDMRLCRLDGNTTIEPTQLITACAQAFSSAAPPAGGISETVLQNQLHTLRKHQITPVLVIDNIDKLNVAALDKLAEMLDWQAEEQYLLQAVLTSKALQTRLSAKISRLHTLHIPTLSADEVSSYLMARLQGVGYQGEIPFKDRDIRRFYRRSEGIPARINQLAHQRLLGVARLTPQWLRFHRLGRYFKWLAYGVLVVMIALALFYQTQINALFNPVSTEPDKVIIPPDDDELATVNVEDDQITSKQQADRQELETLVNELETDLQSSAAKPALMLDTQWLAAMQAYIDQQNDTPSVPTSLTLDGALNLSKPPPEPPAATTAATDPLAELTSRPDIHAADWILSRPGTDYTFQLMGSWEVREISKFIDQYALSGDVAVFSSRRQGKNWHALIYGQYPSRAEAQKARDSWAPPRDTLSNWLRRFDSVQTQIKERPPQP